MRMSARALATASWALLALLLGHQAAYLLVFRDPQVLAHVLADTGHHWLANLPLLIGFAAAIGAVGSWRDRAPLRRSHRLVALVALQLAAYLVLEVGERLAHGIPLADLPATLMSFEGVSLLAVGLATQLVAALLAALAGRSVAEVLRAVRSTPASRRRTVAAIVDRVAHLLVARPIVAHGLRAPPSVR